MESSEQLPYDDFLDPNDSSIGSEGIAVASSENCAEFMPLITDDPSDLMGYLDKDNAILVIDSVEPPKIEFNVEQVIPPKPHENISLYPEQDPSIEHALSQSISENNIHEFLMQCGLNNVRVVSNAEIEMSQKNDGLQNFDKNETYAELAQINSNNNIYSPEALGYHTEEKEEETTEMVFIPTTSQVISLSNNSGYLHVSGVVHPTGVVSKLLKNGGIKCARNVSEGSVIASQTHADSSSRKMVDGVGAVDKENNSNSLHEEHMAFEVETSSPTVEESSSVFMPPQDIDHAVSVIHAATSALDQDGRTKGIQVDKSQAEETGQPDITLPAVTNVTYLECTNLRQSLNSEFSERFLIDESSNHSDLHSGTDSSNKDDTVNRETSTVEEIVHEDANESIHFPPEFPCENIVDDYSKQKDSINYNNDSNTSVDFDRSQILENKIFDLSSKSCENEMAYTNSEEACSEIQSCTERTFVSLGDNSDSESSFFSASSCSKDQNLHMLKKSKSVSPNKVKIIDEYNFEDYLSNLGQELNHNSSLDCQSSEMVNSNDLSTEVDATKVSRSMNSNRKGMTGNLTFKGILTPVTDDTKLVENRGDGGHEIYYDNSQYLLDQGPQHEEEHSSSKMLKSTTAKFCKNEHHSIFSEVNSSNENIKSDGNILAQKNAVNIDNRSKENDWLILNIDASYETIVNSPQKTYSRKKRNSDSNRNIKIFSDDLSDNESYPTQKIFCEGNKMEQIMFDEYAVANEDGCVNLMPSYIKNRIKAKGTHPVNEKTLNLRPETADCLEKIPDPVLDAENSVSACGVNFDNKSKENDSIFSNIATSDETTVKPPQRTYGRKKKTSYPSRNIELFSDDLYDSEPYSTPKIYSPDNEKEQIIIDESSSADEDGYVNLMPSNIKNKICSPLVDESVISLKPESSDLNLLENYPNLDMVEDSVKIYYGTCLMETSFKPTGTKITDGIAPKVSSPDVPKAVSLKRSLEKRVQTPSYEKISAKIDSFKSGQVQDKMIKNSPFEMKNLSSIKRKIREKVKSKKEKTLRNSENFNRSSISMAHKKVQPIKNGVRSVGFLHSLFSSPGEENKFGIKFTSGGVYKKIYCPFVRPSTTSTTQELIDSQYTCSNCEFSSSKVNNLVAHLKYRACRPPADRIHDMGKRRRVCDKSSESFSPELEFSSSPNFSNGSVIHHHGKTCCIPKSEALRKAYRMHNTPLSTSKKPHCRQ